MGVETKHPQYVEFELDWRDMQAALKGEREIKRSGVEYLPMTAGMIEANRTCDSGSLVYKTYKQRAQFQEWVKDSIRSMIGLVSRQESKKEVKHKVLEGLIDQATDDGFGLDELFVRSVANGVEFGRYGLLSDFDDSGKPYIAMYDALSIINWKVGNVGGRRDLTLVVLKEDHLNADDEFSHDVETVYRVLDLDESGFYRVRLFKDGDLIETIEPKFGSTRVSFIPFVFGGSINNSHEINPIPLLTMARCSIKHYQLSADYFQSLYMTAHPQPYAIGIDGPKQEWSEEHECMVDVDDGLRFTGATSVWLLPPNSEVGYLEINGNGISLIREEMEIQKNTAVEAGAKVIDAGSNESGEARRARQDDQHATLHTIVAAASNAIEQSIKYIAEWLKLSTDGIVYSVPLEFSAQVDSTMLTKLYDMAIAGKISFGTVWDYVRTGKVPENDYESEIEKVESEMANLPLNRSNAVD